MIKRHTRYLVYVICFAVSFTSCKDQWDEHNEILDENINLDLYQKISETATLSTFKSFLDKTHYSDTLANSKTYTVWAPDNKALESLDPLVANDTAWLKKFVAYHISNQAYTSASATDSLRVKTLSGKYAGFTGPQFENSNISAANGFAKNGILHIIDAPVVPKLSIWEFVKASSEGIKERNFLASLEAVVLDSSLAEVERYDAQGKPILKPNTGYVVRNKYFQKVANLNDESKQYTFFLLADNAWDSEYSKVAPFFNTDSTHPDSTTSYLTSLNVSKDLVAEGIYTSNSTGPIVSIGGTKIPVSPEMLNQFPSYRASNGIVYVLNNSNFDLKEKFKSIMIEGESTNLYTGNGTMTGRFTYRTLIDPSGVVFKDIQVYDHKLSSFSLFYTLNNVPSATYNVYWRAVAGTAGDKQTAVFQQRVGYRRQLSSDPITYLSYTQVGLASDPANYEEKLVGQMVVSKYGTYSIYLNANATGTAGQNTVVLDYLRLEPVLP